MVEECCATAGIRLGYLDCRCEAAESVRGFRDELSVAGSDSEKTGMKDTNLALVTLVLTFLLAELTLSLLLEQH